MLSIAVLFIDRNALRTGRQAGMLSQTSNSKTLCGLSASGLSCSIVATTEKHHAQTRVYHTQAAMHHTLTRMHHTPGGSVV